MITAIVPAAFAVLETIIQLLWSLGLGFLVLAMVLASPFFWLEPVLVFVYSLARQALYLLFRDIEHVNHPNPLGGMMSTNHFSSAGRRSTWVSSAAIASLVSLIPVL